MDILFDSNGLQAAVHLGRHPNPRSVAAQGKRLGVLLGILQDLGCGVRFTQENTTEITDDMLAGCSVLVVATRMPRLPAPSASELMTIHRFVAQGGGLLVMSNHPWPAMPNPIPDLHLASVFRVTLSGPVYPAHAGRSGLTNITAANLPTHPITSGLTGPVVFNNGCRLNATGGNVIATLPGEQLPPNAFAVETAAQEDNSGRIVVTADSGFIGNDDTDFPGPGLIEQGENKAFIRQIIEWLLRKR
jgi:hypothetical protein